MRLLNNLIEKLNIKKENIIPIILSLVIVIIFFIDSNLWGHKLFGISWIVLGIIFLTLMGLIMLIAGFAIMETLVHVAVSLTLIIFIAQSYCSVIPKDVKEEHSSLFFLIFIGLSYVIYNFFSHLIRELKKYYSKIEKEKWTFEKILVISSFLFFITMFIIAIFTVIKPIIFNLCIY